MNSERKVYRPIHLFTALPIYLFTIIFFCLAIPATRVSIASSGVSVHNSPSVIPTARILNISGSDYSSIASMFKCMGIIATNMSLPECEALHSGDGFLIVPHSEALLLTAEQSDVLTAHVKQGCRLITDGESGLSRSLGLQFLDTKSSVRRYLWKNRTEALVSFSEELSITRFQPGKGMDRWGIDTVGNDAIAVSAKLGKGGFIYTAIAPAPPDKPFYARFPFFHEAIFSEFKVRPVLSRRDLALYLDLGLHPGERPHDLARKIKAWGIDQVHLSAWYPGAEGKRFTKDFIASAHALGITVYAWFEYPMVSRQFWDKHPECREKTATGRDAMIDWRYLIALEDPECFDLVKLDMSQTMMRFDWDGLDIAELYFESPLGFDSPDTFTPMHPSFRKDFMKRWGVDPRDIFQPDSPHFRQKDNEISRKLLDYRIELIGRLNESLLELCRDLRKGKPHLQTIMTVIDTIFDAAMKERIGVDTDRFIQLQKEYPFTLEIEDPYTLWNLGPDRYKLIGERYRSLTSAEHPFYIDINIVERQGVVYPTAKQRGLELYQLLYAASLYTDKVILYGSATLEPSDMAFAPYARVQDVDIEQSADGRITFNSGKQFIWETSTGNKQYLLDGADWPCFSQKGVIIPAGRHTIRCLDRPKKDGVPNLRLEDINGTVMRAAADGKKIILEYESHERCYATFNRDLRNLRVDGALFKAAAIRNGGKTIVVLPQGRHRLTSDE